MEIQAIGIAVSAVPGLVYSSRQWDVT